MKKLVLYTTILSIAALTSFQAEASKAKAAQLPPGNCVMQANTQEQCDNVDKELECDKMNGPDGPPGGCATIKVWCVPTQTYNEPFPCIET